MESHSYEYTGLDCRSGQVVFVEVIGVSMAALSCNVLPWHAGIWARMSQGQDAAAVIAKHDPVLRAPFGSAYPSIAIGPRDRWAGMVAEGKKYRAMTEYGIMARSSD
ncbi:hypothetical protein CFAM422_005913 [Trichoderma lentiforme]|uniref:Uncharacterized protein n=1 Tax=Trichoderma lentiforme TaxID=1567552 RepID=A0A9P4XGI8_9HYPO|nr:hypothetical protein CFAM422_005913 [Trichoderma lentiforme]